MQIFFKVYIILLILMQIKYSSLQPLPLCANKCSFCSDGKCLTCFDGFYINHENGSCQLCPQYPICQKCDTNGTCLSCEEGFKIDNVSGICQTTQNCSSFLNCSKCSVSDCKECNDGFYLMNGKCLPCVQNCQSCINELTCLTCFPSYALSYNQCKLKCSPPIKGCITCAADNKCLECQEGYTLHNDTCQKCTDPNCLRCNTISCTLCRLNFKLNLKTNNTTASCLPNSTCLKYDVNNTCTQCSDEPALSNEDCIACSDDEYSFNNECFKCQNKFTKSARCTAYSIISCIDDSTSLYGCCICNSSFVSMNGKCISIVLIIAIGVLIIFVIIISVGYVVKRKRKLNPFIINAPVEYEVTNSENNEEVIELRMLNGDETHGNTCVFNDGNIPYWKLNCGGYICNECSLNIISKLCNKEHILCTKCETGIKFFDYVERRTDQIADTQNSVNKSIQNIILKFDLNVINKCQICFYFEADKRIECGSSVPHFVCSYCFKRLFLIGKSEICPFCRSQIKEVAKN